MAFEKLLKALVIIAFWLTAKIHSGIKLKNDFKLSQTLWWYIKYSMRSFHSKDIRTIYIFKNIILFLSSHHITYSSLEKDMITAHPFLLYLYKIKQSCLMLLFTEIVSPTFSDLSLYIASTFMLGLLSVERKSTSTKDV